MYAKDNPSELKPGSPRWKRKVIFTPHTKPNNSVLLVELQGSSTSVDVNLPIMTYPVTSAAVPLLGSVLRACLSAEPEIFPVWEAVLRTHPEQGFKARTIVQPSARSCSYSRPSSSPVTCCYESARNASPFPCALQPRRLRH